MKNDNATKVAKFLKLQGRAFSLVIECPNTLSPVSYAEWLDKSLSALVKYCAFRYWLILHDMDEKEDKSLVRPHIHLVLDYGRTATIERIVNFIGDSLGFPAFVLTDEQDWGLNPMLSIDVCHNRIGAIRYLMHLDNEDKTRYSPEKVYTNASKELSRAIKCANALGVDIDYLFEVVVLSNCNIISIMKELGCDAYLKYRNIIRDMVNSLTRQ